MLREHRPAGEAPRASCLEGSCEEASSALGVCVEDPLLSSHSASREVLRAALGQPGARSIHV